MLYLSWKSERISTILCDKISDGKVFLASTDTVLGLMAKATPTGKSRLDAIKQRCQKPYIVLIDSINELKTFVGLETIEYLETFLSTIWPGPVSIIFPTKKDAPPFYRGVEEKIAIRMPNHQGLRIIIEQCGPLFSTSANISTMPTPENLQEVSPLILKEIDTIVLDDSIEKKRLPSTIIEYTNKKIHVIRLGAFDHIALIKQYEATTKKKYMFDNW